MNETHETDPVSAKCPNCGHKVIYRGPDKGTSDFFPFCSKRCKLVDLDRWLKEEHCITSKPKWSEKPRDTGK